jgi:para-aminobenzoate synthetase component I
MTLSEFESTLNRWGKEKTPFLFIIDFELKRPLAFKLEMLGGADDILFDVNGNSNIHHPVSDAAADLVTTPEPLSEYEKKFRTVMSNLEIGNSYLVNLTIKTPITSLLNLRDIYFRAKAKYKLFFKNHFLVFSPETFIQIKNGQIFSFPMKGTINASIPNAQEIIINDEKELAEHVTIVDLIRNDLSTIARDVHVKRFRYIDPIRTSSNLLLQVSSEIAGTLPADYSAKLGTIILLLLPAGSVTGAPKVMTVNIIQQAEKQNRGYYTGVFGIYDGKELDSGVMIRFIENDNGRLFYRSGGGITTQSSCEQEYKEAIEKIYVPLD